MTSSADDEHWVARLRDGDRNAAEEFLFKYRDEICRYIAIVLRSKSAVPAAHTPRGDDFNSTVESIFNAAWMKLISRLQSGSFDGDGSDRIIAYLNRIARNQIFEKNRQLRRYPVQLGDDESRLLSATPSPVDQALEQEFALAFESLIASLAAPDQQLVRMRQAGKTFPEIAEILGRPEPSLRAAHSRLIRFLRETTRKGF
jgi:RNA polymerase sigma factor (sigma-70 family)